MTRKSLRTKRIFSIILSLAVALTMMPMSAFAAGDAAVQAEGNVAEVTTANGTSLGQYATLADAIKAAQGSGGSTVKLLADIKTNYHKETKDGNT